MSLKPTLFRKAIRTFGPYATLLAVAAAFSYLTRSFPGIAVPFTEGANAFAIVIALILALSYWVNRVAPKTVLPSFVWMIFFGVALQPLLVLFTENLSGLTILVELLAALILFGGGVEVPFKSFSRWFAPIATLALLGTLITAVLFALGLNLIAGLFGAEVSVIAIVLVAIILSSTDPTAIIPSLKQIHFRKPFLRDLVVSESAMNDVFGSIITRLLLVAIVGGAVLEGGVLRVASSLVSRETYEALTIEIVTSIIIGLLGAWMLKRWVKRTAAEKGKVSDPALFLATPILVYAFGTLAGGSGFLAAFVTGLLFEAETHVLQVRHFFETFVDSFVKPIVFVLLGALVPLSVLLETAPLGITAALFFMFVVRPIVVFSTLSPWMLKRKAVFSFRELLFVSFVRETGAIPAILLIIAAASGVADAEFIFAIGIWIILATLIFEPPLTPLVAKRLHITRD